LRCAAHTIEQAVFGVDVKVGELPWHRLDYSIWTRSPRRRIFRCQEPFLVIVISVLICPRFCPNPPSSFRDRSTLREQIRTKGVAGGTWFCARLGKNPIRSTDAGRSQQ
jgi:hypothetical protein